MMQEEEAHQQISNRSRWAADPQSLLHVPQEPRQKLVPRSSQTSEHSGVCIQPVLAPAPEQPPGLRTVCPPQHLDLVLGA